MLRIERRSILKAAGTGSIAGLAGCTDVIQSGDGDGGSNDTLEIGITSVFSGPYSIEGQYQRQGAELAAEQLNEDGGVNGRDVEIRTKDTEADPNVGTRRLQEFIDDSVNYVMTGISSGVANAMQPIAEENNILLMHASPSDPALTGENCSQNAFRNRTNVVTEANALAPYLLERFDSFLYFGSDYGWGQRGAEEYQTRVEEAGKEWLGAEFPPFGADDFGPFFNAIEETEPECVIAYIATVPKFVNQMAEFGYRDQITLAGTGHLTEYQLLDAIGDPAGAGILSPSWYSHEIDTPENKDFQQAFRNKYDQAPQRHAESNYAGVKMIAQAIENAGSATVDDVIPEMEEIDMATPIGQRTMRAEDHQAALDTYVTESYFDDNGDAQKEVKKKVAGPDTLGEVRCNF